MSTLETILAAHDKGLVHGDVRGANILVDEVNHRTVLIDWSDHLPFVEEDRKIIQSDDLIDIYKTFKYCDQHWDALRSKHLEHAKYM